MEIFLSLKIIKIKFKTEGALNFGRSVSRSSAILCSVTLADARYIT